MISNAFKKQLIINYYNTQLLPVMENKVHSYYIEANKRIKIWLLFRIDKFLRLYYKYKTNTIDYDIFELLKFLIDQIQLIYYYDIKKESDIQENISSNISSNIKYTIKDIQNIDNRLDYVKYLEDIYD